MPTRGYDEDGKAGGGEERRIKLRFQSLGAVECDSLMHNHTRRLLSLEDALQKQRIPMKNNEIIGGGGDNHIAL
jgi:hypothetical protein